MVTPDDESEEFIRSVQRDLDALPTIEERDRKTLANAEGEGRSSACSGRIRATFSVFFVSW